MLAQFCHKFLDIQLAGKWNLYKLRWSVQVTFPQIFNLTVTLLIWHLCVTYGFLTSLFSVAVNCSITIFFACYCISVEGWKLLYIIGLIEALIFCGLGWLLSGFTVSVAFFLSLIWFWSRPLFAANKQNISLFFFSCYMLQWTWQPMKCSTTKDTTTWRTAEVNITTLTQGGSFTIWLSFSCAFNRLRLRICQPLSY